MTRLGIGMLLLLLASPAAAWEIKTSGPVTITGTGALPTLTPTPPPPVVDPPPLPPPPVVPPIVDNAPFVFPVQQPGQETDGSCRYFQPLCPNSGTCYATLPNCGNPLRQSHLFACYLPMGMLFQKTQSIGGLRLYVPRDLTPGLIRLLCAGGAI